MTKMTAISIILLSILLTQIKCRQLNKYLTKNLLTKNDMLAKYNKDKSNAAKQQDKDKIKESNFSYFADLTNVTNLLKVMKSQKPSGKGSFGKVFKVKGVDYDSPTVEKKYAAKIIRFDNEGDTTNGKEEQQMLQQELEIGFEFDTLDENHFFFPKYYQVYNMSGSFHSIYNSSHNKNFD